MMLPPSPALSECDSLDGIDDLDAFLASQGQLSQWPTPPSLKKEAIVETTEIASDIGSDDGLPDCMLLAILILFLLLTCCQSPTSPASCPKQPVSTFNRLPWMLISFTICLSAPICHWKRSHWRSAFSRDFRIASRPLMPSPTHRRTSSSSGHLVLRYPTPMIGLLDPSGGLISSATATGPAKESISQY